MRLVRGYVSQWMKSAVLIVLIVASALLVSIIGFTGVVAVRRANRINEEIVRTNSKFHETGRNLEALRADFDAMRIAVRDYMLDPVAGSADERRSQLLRLRTSIDGELDALGGLLEPQEAPAVEALRMELSNYFESAQEILNADPRSFPGGIVGIRRRLTSRREAIVGVTHRIEEIDAHRFEHESEAIEEARKELSSYLSRMTWVGVILGVIIAVVGGHRISILQRVALLHQSRIEKSEEERRRLSAELVRAQEAERKSISRELHDEVGQTLTALGIELGNIQRLRSAAGSEFDEHVQDAKDLTQGALKTVRDIAMGLRPSMLDDSGLLPALRWQVREFSKRTGVPVALETDVKMEGLGDAITTCIYRVVQEALTNCARHAQAENVRIVLHAHAGTVQMEIQDDGAGFDTSKETIGLGLVGMKERVQDVGGEMKVSSRQNQGTLLTVKFPLQAES